MKLHSRKVFLATWFYCGTLILYFYECNLRAYLLKIDYEPAINTEEDILAQDRAFYLPIGAPFLNFICDSEKQTHKTICKRVKENNHMFQYERGYPTKAFDIVSSIIQLLLKFSLNFQ